MQRALFTDSPPFTMLIMLGFTMVTCFLLFMLTGILLAPLVFGIPVDDFLHTVNSGDIAQQLNVMRYVQVLYSVSIFIIPAFLSAYLFSGNAIRYFGLRLGASIKWYIATLLIIFAAIPCINMLAALNEMIVFPDKLLWLEQKMRNFEDSARQTTLLFLNVDTAGGLFFNLFMIAILPAIGEELIFRGLLHNIFAKWTGNVHIANIFTGFLFSLMHLQFYGFFPRWLLGIMFGYMMIWSGTIWLPVFAHFVNNALAVYFTYLINKGMLPEEIEIYGTNPVDMPFTIAATLVCIALMWIMYRTYNDFSKKSTYLCNEKNLYG